MTSVFFTSSQTLPAVVASARCAEMTINSEWVSILKTSHPTAFKESLHTVPVTWFVDGQIIEQVIPESEIYKREWVGLTDEEQQQAYEQWQNEGWGVFYKAIEAKLKEKNT